ncbi:hypothetical protein ACFR99_07775 [Haloarchaeobius amylolyticus]|uniref:Secreted protein n=1 Tax=Haloarchaeobius amylolyticus TaxID=1198296 RepID=A0ABD6BEG2_9EURY
MTPPVSAALALLGAWVLMMFWATTADNTADTEPADWVDPVDDRSEHSSETTASDNTFHTADD